MGYTIYWFGEQGAVAGLAVKPTGSPATTTRTVVSSNHAVLSITTVIRGSETAPYPPSNVWVKLPGGGETNGNYYQILSSQVINELKICTVDRDITEGVYELAPKLKIGTQVKMLSNLTHTWEPYVLFAIVGEYLEFKGRIVIAGESGSPIMTMDDKYVSSALAPLSVVGTDVCDGVGALAYPGIYLNSVSSLPIPTASMVLPPAVVAPVVLPPVAVLPPVVPVVLPVLPPVPVTTLLHQTAPREITMGFVVGNYLYVVDAFNNIYRNSPPSFLWEKINNLPSIV